MKVFVCDPDSSFYLGHLGSSPLFFDVSTREKEDFAFFYFFKMQQAKKKYEDIINENGINAIRELEALKASLELGNIPKVLENHVRLIIDRDLTYTKDFEEKRAIQKRLYERSINGDVESIKELVTIRKRNRGEFWQIVKVKCPLLTYPGAFSSCT